MKKVLSLVLSIALMLTLVACGNAASKPAASASAGAEVAAGNFILGCPQPLTGTNALPGECALNAVKLAAKQINEAGGFNGQQITVVSYDDQGSPEEAVKVASKLVENDKVNAVIGSCISSCVLSSSNILNDAKIPVFGTGTSPTWMQQGWKYVFRACQNNDFALPVVVDLWKELGITKIAVFAGQDDAAVAGSETIQTLCKAAGIEVATVESYVEGDTDFSGQCAKMINSGAEVMFVSTYGPTQPLIAKQLRQYGFEGLCFTKDIYQVDALQVAGAASDGFAFAYPYLTYASIDDCKVENVKAFLQAYEAEYGELPTSDCAYRAYDSVLVLQEAIKKAGATDGDSIKDAVNDITDFKALGGIMDYSMGDGEGLHTCNVFIIDDETYQSWDEWYAAGGYDSYKK
ncbi:MAG: ABC transporter substrate-binding protein [Ruthenibacterium sp.]